MCPDDITQHVKLAPACHENSYLATKWVSWVNQRTWASRTIQRIQQHHSYKIDSGVWTIGNAICKQECWDYVGFERTWICKNGLDSFKLIYGLTVLHSSSFPSDSYSGIPLIFDASILVKRSKEKLVCGGCRKFLLLFGRIGPLALRPCALLRAWGFLPHSINILQIPLWYDVIWCVLRSPLRPLARPCIFDASISCSQNPISPEDVIERTGFL